MNFLDIIILIPISYAAWIGFKKGFIIEVFTLLALIVGLYAGIHFSELVATKIKSYFETSSNYISPFAFTITFLAVGAMVFFAGKALEKIVKAVLLSPLNKVGGVFFAVLKASYFVSILLILFSSFDKNNHFIPLNAKIDSLLYYRMQNFSIQTIPGFKKSGLLPENNDSITPVMTLEEMKNAKHIADSLGIEAKDLVELHDIYQKSKLKK